MVGFVRGRSRAGRLSAPVVLLSLSAIVGCGGGSGGGGGSAGPTVTFTASGTDASAEGIRLTGAAVDTTTVQMNVVMDRSTPLSDVYAVAFDLELGNASAYYVDKSAVLGTVLQSPNKTLEVHQDGNRIVVGATILQDPIGSTVAAGTHTVLSLKLRVPNAGTNTSITFQGSPGNPLSTGQDPAVLDHAGNSLGVPFDPLPAAVTR